MLGLRQPGLEFRILCLKDSVISQSSHHPREVVLAQFSLYVHKGGLKPDSFHFIIAMQLCSYQVTALCLGREWIFLYVAFCTIIVISRQKEVQSRDYALLLYRMTSRVLYSAQYYKDHYYTIDSTARPMPLNSQEN